MSYNPSEENKYILDRALGYVNSVPYQVTNRWVFYRLLQDGTYSEKKSYRHLLSISSKARKEFYGGWHPGTLADDTRAPVLMQRDGLYSIAPRGWGFKTRKEWMKTLKKELNCPLDRWRDQPIYAEIWFEAAAMQGQFLHYANENIPLLAFHGDVSIPEKWRTAMRLSQRWRELKKPIRIFYYGDLDPKGLQIPDSAWEDISKWAFWLAQAKNPKLDIDDWVPFHWKSFVRVGIQDEQVKRLSIPENPERPGTYQWEALDDKQAAELIAEANKHLDLEAFDEVKAQEAKIIEEIRRKLKD